MEEQQQTEQQQTEQPAAEAQLEQSGEVLGAAPVAVEFYTTKSGSHRARIGRPEEVPNPDGEGTVQKVVTPVLTSESYESLSELGQDLTLALAGTLSPVILGEAPDTFRPVWPPQGGDATMADAAALAPAGAEAPDRLLDQQGEQIDRRKIAVFVELDRVHERFMDRRAAGILHRLAQGKTIPEAVAEVNTLAAGPDVEPLTDRQGHDLAQREVYKLALYSTLVSNRKLVPSMDRVL